VTRVRILVGTPDTLAPGMAGPAIRAWHIADELSRSHDVKLVTTSTSSLAAERFGVAAISGPEMPGLLSWCDVVVSQGWFLHQNPDVLCSDKVVVVDLYDPLHLEQLEQARDEGEERRAAIVDSARAVLDEQLLRGDFFLCASEKQRDFWLGHLAALGRLNPLTYDEDETLSSLIATVPFGIGQEPAVHTRRAVKGVLPGIGSDDKLVLWGGGIYNWLDPLTAIRAVDKLRARLPEVRLLFMGLRHPNPEIPQMRMAASARELSDGLGLTDSHVIFNEGWVPFEDRQNFLLEADVGISTHLDHLETAFSFRTRVLDYLWAGLPTVSTSGDTLAQLVAERDLGAVVPPGDDAALEEALFGLLTDERRAERCRQNIAGVAPEFRWRGVLQPLVRFCARPRRAPDLVDPAAARRLRPAAHLARIESGAAVTRAARVWRREGWRGVAARLRKRRGAP
jgi:glycosyltransferase involved in cell wall biosynthesis